MRRPLLRIALGLVFALSLASAVSAADSAAGSKVTVTLVRWPYT
jgi:ABC-type proline/glycine betaine transport system substrate-binding protein